MAHGTKVAFFSLVHGQCGNLGSDYQPVHNLPFFSLIFGDLSADILVCPWAHFQHTDDETPSSVLYYSRLVLANACLILLVLHDPYDEEYGGDVGSEEEEWGDPEEAEVGLDQINNDWQERMERKKGKNKG